MATWLALSSIRSAQTKIGAVSMPAARAVTSAVGSAGTGTELISKSSCRVKSMPPGRLRSDDAFHSSGSQETLVALRKPPLVRRKMVSANG